MTKEEIKNWSNENGLGYRSDLHKMYEDLYRSAYAAGASAERQAILGLADSLGWVSVDHIQSRGQA